ncbi:MAG: AAA family ATPase [Lewinellaceae bacterium]|nr:AAA family ATPase [Phaeodactylibacter sp.]MCB9041303.1 AAA family ATPase [Lewinellaceae bacterium]
MKRLPLGIQDFRKLREEDLLYIDKTEDIYRLIQSGYYYFLSRPRRFGKSLLLSTLQEIFLGSKELFEGLWIEDKIEWVKHPVVHISFNAIGYKDLGLDRAIERELSHIAENYGLRLESEGISGKFRELLERLASKGKKVVLLIDEYDKPIVDYIDDVEKADQQRDILKNFYSIIKSADPSIRFFLVTGVSKFSRVSLFSDLNNLRDITLSPKFSCLTGYTHQELNHYFADRIERICKMEGIPKDQLVEQIIHWYDGYSWDGKHRLFNPFSILSYFSDESFFNYWWQTGTPSFLIKLLRKGMHYQLEEVEGGQDLFESYTLDNLEYRSLLFQTGYLTIHAVEPYGLYSLGYPNKEVRDSMYRHLLGAFRHAPTAETQPLIVKIKKALDAKNVDGFIQLVNILFETPPYQIFIEEREAFFHAILHIALNATGMFVETEVSTSKGRVDAVIHSDSTIYVMEFKLDESADEALQQIRQQRYGSKYLGREKEVLALGINFSSKQKAVTEWKAISYEQLLVEA